MPRERQSLMMRTFSSDSRSSSSTPSLASPGVASELADLARDLPDRRVAVGALLDGSPASLGEARVRPPLLLPLPAWPLCQLWSSPSSDVSRRRHCRPDTTGVHNTAALVRMTLRSARVKPGFEQPMYLTTMD
jgi:hypothetical protein